MHVPCAELHVTWPGHEAALDHAKHPLASAVQVWTRSPEHWVVPTDGQVSLQTHLPCVGLQDRLPGQAAALDHAKHPLASAVQVWI